MRYFLQSYRELIISGGGLPYSMVLIIISIFLSYLLGSIPTAYLFGRIKGIDIRKHGSGNIGATNALRILGKKAGVLVLLIDIAKGFIGTVLFGDLARSISQNASFEWIYLIIGLSCIAGHIWTVFLNFKGGKEIATTLGVLIGLAFRFNGLGIVLGLVLLSWVIVFLVTRIVSFSSIVSAIAFPVMMCLYKQPIPLIIFAFLVSFVVLLRHKTNLRRLISGKESKLY